MPKRPVKRRRLPPARKLPKRVQPKAVGIHIPERAPPIIVIEVPLAHVAPLAQTVEIELPESFWHKLGRWFG